MPRDWLREERAHRQGRWEDPGYSRDPLRREDYGQADYSSDYGYDVDRREGYRTAEEAGLDRDDFGQADYSTDYVFDPDMGETYRRDADRYRREPRSALGERDRSWAGRGRPTFFGGREAEAARRRRGPSDRVLWAVIVERLEDQRGLDLRDVEVLVDNAEVTLNGTVRRKEDKRRIEDVADIDGVRHVQNNLRVREGLRRWF